jgi:polysaccharide biosynthesis protein PslG
VAAAPLSARARRLAAALAALTALVAAGCGGSESSSTQSSGPPPVSSAPPDFYGVAANIADVLEPEDYANMQAAGVRTLRIVFLWPSIQSAAGHPYSWSSIDAKVEAAAMHGIAVQPVLIGTPSFLTGCSERDCQVRLPNKTPEGSAAWQAFLAAAATRYGPDGQFWTEHPELDPQPVRLWEIWNEENNFNSAGQPRVTPQEFTDLLKISREALRRVDPNAETMVGGMFGTPHGSTDPRVTAWGFTQGLYEAGAAPYFDAIALHPYSTKVPGVAYQMNRVRHVMVANGDSQTPMYVTEIGWGSDAAHVNHEFVTTVSGQARNLADAFNVFVSNRKRWNLRGVNWFDWRDPPPGKGLCAFCYSSGLYFNDGTPKPSLAEYKRFALAGS